MDLIDSRTRERRLRLVPPRFREPFDFIVAEPVFLPSGRDVVVEQIQNAPNPDGPASVLHRFDGRTGAVQGPPAGSGSLAFSPDGRLLAVAGSERPTEIRDARSGRLVVRLETPDVGRSVAWAPARGSRGSRPGAGALP